MELSEKEWERIVAEEKARLEARREYFREHWGGPWGHHGCGGCGCGRGHGLFRLVLLVAVIAAVVHFWHRPCGYPPYGYGVPAVQAPAVPAAPTKK